MPTPDKGESKKSFLARCIPMLIDEGREQNAAIAICNSMYDQHKSKSNNKYGRTFKETGTDRILSI